ncbi:hypothetical protein GCM10007199_06890 [Fictibacillus barbaricus]|nr:hypothetical protein GCM10007199_06890 [Fictibacillus barbaricus]
MILQQSNHAHGESGPGHLYVYSELFDYYLFMVTQSINSNIGKYTVKNGK